MKRALKILTILGCLTYSAISSADISVKLEPGVAVPLTPPQSERFDTGGAMTVKGLVGIVPAFDLGLSLSAIALSSDVPNVDMGASWHVGGTARLKRPHDHENNTGAGFTAVSPWVDGDLQYVRTDELNRAGVAVGVGAAFPTSDTRNVWVGPFARYQNIFQAEKISFDTNDARIAIIGLSVELGPTQQKKVVPTPTKPPVKPQPPSDRDKDGVPDSSDRCPDVPGPVENFGCPYPEPTPPVQTPERFEFQGKVQFDWDSYVIRTGEQDALDVVAKTILAHKDYKVKIDGHASSEGTEDHNDVLSRNRADAVAVYLVSKGVSVENISTQGFGESVPVASNATEQGRQANRRVEFVVNFVLVKE